MSTKGRGRQVEGFNIAVISVLNDIIAENQMTHEELAQITSIPRSTITKLLNCTSALDVNQLYKITNALSVAASDVWKAAETRSQEEANTGHTPFA